MSKKNLIKRSVLVCFLLFCFEALTMASEVSLLVVEGVGEVQVEPDLAFINLGVNRRAATAKTAQEEVNEALKGILAGIENLGIPGKNIQTSRLNLNPIYVQTDRRAGEAPKIVGYEANYSISIRVDQLQLLGEIIDSALGEDANQLQGVRFELSNDTASKSEALKMAVEAARQKAKVLSDSAGVKLLSIKEIKESNVDLIQPRGPQVRAMYAESSGSPTPVLPGMITVSASVIVTWIIED